MALNAPVEPRAALSVSARHVRDLMVRWRSRAGAWALVGLLFSTSFTVFNLVLALLLSLRDFGLFSYGQSLVLLVGIFVSNLIIEPTSTVGMHYEEEEELRYLAFALIGVFVVGLAIALPIAAIFALVKTSAAAQPLIVAVLVSPFVQSFHVGRRYLYIRERFGFLILLGFAHAGLLLAAPAVLFLAGLVSPSTALLATGIAGAVPALCLVVYLRLWRHIPDRSAIGRYARDHWGYSRWTLAAAAPHWLATSGMVPVSIWLFSLEAGSIYRIAQLAIAPIVQLSQLLSQIFLPFVAQRARAGAVAYLASVGRKVFWLYFTFAVLSTIAVLAVMPLIVDRLIPPPFRPDGIWILLGLLAGTFFDVLRNTQTIMLSAAGRTEYLFWSAIIGTTVMYLAIAVLLYPVGVAAIAIGFGLGRFGRYASIRFFAARRAMRDPA